MALSALYSCCHILGLLLRTSTTIILFSSPKKCIDVKHWFLGKITLITFVLNASGLGVADKITNEKEGA